MTPRTDQECASILRRHMADEPGVLDSQYDAAIVRAIELLEQWPHCRVCGVSRDA